MSGDKSLFAGRHECPGTCARHWFKGCDQNSYSPADRFGRGDLKRLDNHDKKRQNENSAIPSQFWWILKPPDGREDRSRNAETSGPLLSPGCESCVTLTTPFTLPCNLCIRRFFLRSVRPRVVQLERRSRSSKPRFQSLPSAATGMMKSSRRQTVIDTKDL